MIEIPAIIVWPFIWHDNAWRSATENVWLDNDWYWSVSEIIKQTYPWFTTDDGAGNVTLHGNATTTYDEVGGVTLTPGVVVKYEDGNVTIEGGI